MISKLTHDPRAMTCPLYKLVRTLRHVDSSVPKIPLQSLALGRDCVSAIHRSILMTKNYVPVLPLRLRLYTKVIESSADQALVLSIPSKEIDVFRDSASIEP